MAKDTFDKKTRDLIPQKWKASYTFVNEERRLRNGAAVVEAPDKEQARTAIATDLEARYGRGNWKISKVEIW